MSMIDEIRAKRDEIYAIARKHKAEKPWGVGSFLAYNARKDMEAVWRSMLTKSGMLK